MRAAGAIAAPRVPQCAGIGAGEAGTRILHPVGAGGEMGPARDRKPVIDARLRRHNQVPGCASPMRR